MGIKIEPRVAEEIEVQDLTATSRVDYSGKDGALACMRWLYENDRGAWWLVGVFSASTPAASVKRAAIKDAWIQENGLEVESTIRKIEPQKNGSTGFYVWARLAQKTAPGVDTRA